MILSFFPLCCSNVSGLAPKISLLSHLYVCTAVYSNIFERMTAVPMKTVNVSAGAANNDYFSNRLVGQLFFSISRLFR